MTSRFRTFGPVGAVFALGGLLVTSCGSDSTTTDTASLSDSAAPSDGGTESESSTAWAATPLTDVAGESFTIADLAGTPVFVENFATWCSNCLRQLGDTERAAAEAGDSAVFLALSVETDLDPAKVAAYAEKNGFDHIRFAVMTPEFLAATDDAFGTTALNPPSTPKILVTASGTPGDLVTGFESPDDILAKLDGAA